MSTVFLGGSRRVMRVPRPAIPLLHALVDSGDAAIVGDSNDADHALQQFLAERRYAGVTVFYWGDTCKSNLGNWPVEAVRQAGKKKDHVFYGAMDRRMSREADRALLLWDGESPGTLMNMWRLLRQRKPVTVASSRETFALSDLADLEPIVAGLSAHRRERFELGRQAELKLDGPALHEAHHPRGKEPTKT